MKQEKIIIYQLLPRLFGNTTTDCVSNGSIEKNGVGKLNDISPKALREIARLGCTHIWYTGVIEHATQTDYSRYGIATDNPHVVKGKAGSPYAIKDYYDIDPDLAVNVPDRMQEFEALIERTHQNKLKAIIDFVPNHVARQYRSDAKPDGITDLGSRDNTAHAFDTHNNFYYIPGQEFSPHFDIGEGATRYNEFPAKATGNDCFSPSPGQNDWYETVKLNYGVDYLNCMKKNFDPIPDTWEKMRDILLFWAGKNIDGFRCDMAEMVPVEFWGWAIPQIKQQYPYLIFIAEVYNPCEYRNYLHNGHFDYLYDKVGLYDLLRNIVNGHASSLQISHCWQSLEGINTDMVNFLENHDEQRVASPQNAGDPFKAYPALIVSAMMNRNPFLLYFGQELGEPGTDAEGFSGYDGRTTIFDYWSVPSIRNWYNNGRCNDTLLTDDQTRLREMYRQVLTLCNKEGALREGDFFDLMYVNFDNEHFDAKHNYAFLRKYKNDLLLIAVNFNAWPANTEICIPQHAFDCWNMIPGEYECEELLRGEKTAKNISPDRPFETSIHAYGAVAWKCKIKTTRINTKKSTLTDIK